MRKPKITYVDGGSLKYVVDTGLDGGSFTAETIDSNVLYRNSLCLASAHVSYYYTYAGANDLKYAYRDGASWAKETVASAGDVGSYSSLQADRNTGQVDIAYYDATNKRLKYITKSATWSSPEIVDSVTGGSYCSMLLYYTDATNAGCPVMTYLDEGSGRVRFAYNVMGNMFGYVKAQTTGLPISGATVTLYSGSTYTGKYATTTSTGYFQITGIGVGSNYTLEVQKSGYYDGSSATQTVRPGSQVDVGTINLQLIPVPNLRFGSYTIDDDMVDNSSGDGDSIPEAGETIEMYVNLSNIGTGTAHNVTATISTSDPYVTFLFNTSSSYGEIAPDQSAVNSNDFDFSISSSCPNGHVITFNLNITATEGSWTDSFTVTVYVNPVVNVEYYSHTIDDNNTDESSGDSDGIPEAGETIEMYVYLLNSGNTTAHNVNATISTSDPYVTFLYNTSSPWGDIAAGQTIKNSSDFDFSISPDCPYGHVVTFNLSITATEGSWTDSFTVTIYVNGNPQVQYSSYRADDDNSGNSSGDNDGVVEPGEAIELYVNLLNRGTVTAHNVSATISTSDPYVSFLFNTSSSYGNIAPEQVVSNSDDFDFALSAMCPSGHVITFYLYIYATEGYWTDSFTVTVGGRAGPDDLLQITPWGHIWVSLSDGTQFKAPQRWVTANGFVYDGNNGWVPLMGDIDGDGLNDLVQITPYGHIWVMQSTGTGFLPPDRWSGCGFTFDAANGWIPTIGDVNGDGKADLIETTPYGHIWVMLSTGSSFENPARWGGGLVNNAVNGWIVLVGDFNGDRRDDLLQVTPFGHIWVSLSNGTSLGTPQRWAANGFIFDSDTGWIPTVGDFNGDGKTDMLEYTPYGHMWVSLSTGSSFGAPTRWSTNGFVFDAVNGWLPLTADVNGDGITDTLQVTPYGHVWVSLCNGTSFATPQRWGTPGFVYDGATGWIPMVGNVGP